MAKGGAGAGFSWKATVNFAGGAVLERTASRSGSRMRRVGASDVCSSAAVSKATAPTPEAPRSSMARTESGSACAVTASGIHEPALSSGFLNHTPEVFSPRAL